MRWPGTDVTIDGDEFTILKESDILGVLEDVAVSARICGVIGRWKRIAMPDNDSKHARLKDYAHARGLRQALLTRVSKLRLADARTASGSASAESHETVIDDVALSGDVRRVA